jgi:hypothetical protein
MSGSPSETHGFDVEALDWEAMAHIWRGVTSGAPSMGRRGEDGKEDGGEMGKEEGFFTRFII